MFYLCDPEQLKQYKGYSKKSGTKNADMSSIFCKHDTTFGYSLTSIRLAPKEVVFATGGPRARAIHGEIKIFKFLKQSEYITESFQFLESLKGEHLNSGFGTTMVGADLDGDGVDELIVGEPYRTVSFLSISDFCRQK